MKSANARKRFLHLGAKVLAGALLATGVSSLQAQTAPLYLITTLTTLATPGSFGGPNNNMATDKFGNLIVPDGAEDQVIEFPADGSPYKVVFTDKSGSQVSGVAFDPSGNLYVELRYHGPSTTDSSIYRIPYTASGYGPYTYTGSAPAYCSATSTSVCTYGTFDQPSGGYYQPGSLGFDANGVGYFITVEDTVDGGGKDVYECNAACAYGTENSTFAVRGLPTMATSLAVAPNGDLYWTDGNDIYYSKAGSGTFSVFDTSLESQYGGAQGVNFDNAGNLYGASSGGTYEYPLINGVIAAGSKFRVATPYVYTGSAVGNNGDIFSANYSQVQKTTLNNAQLGSSVVGTAASPVQLTVNFLSGGTVASITASGSSGATTEFAITGDSCSGSAQGVGGSCTFSVVFTPAAVGLRRGTVTLTDTSGNTVTAFVSGIGTGTGISIDPGTPTTVTTSLQKPSGMAVDAAGTVYIADATGNTVSRFASGSTTATVVASNLKKPTGVALDGGGNLLVVEQGGNDLLQFEASASSSTGFSATPATLATGLSSPTDVVVSGTGIIYVSNTGANEVRQFPNSTRLPFQNASSSYGTSLKAPTGLALDNAGNLFIADTGDNQVVEIPVAGGQSVLGSGLSAPTGVAVEPSGSVLIADQGNGRLVRIPNESTGLSSTDQVALPQPFDGPYALRLTSAGNLYVSDNQANAVESLNRTAATLDFGINNLNTASSAQTIIVSSIGNSSLTLGAPLYAPVPASSDFTLIPGIVGTACASGSLAPGLACSLSATFTPVNTGTESYPVALAAPAANAASPTLTLTGQGVQLASVNVTVAQSPAGAVSYGTTITVTATVASAGSSSAAPTGRLTFTVDGSAYKPITLTNGQASLSLPGLSGGSHTVVATYSGDSTFASGSSSTSTIVVNPAVTSGVLTITGTGVNPLSASATDAVSFTVTITPAMAGTLSGTVTFYNGTAVLGTSSVYQTIAPGTAGYPNGQYGASYSFAPSSTLPTPTGVYNVYAVYTPNSNYVGFTTPAQQITIVSSPTYGIQADSTTLTASRTEYGIANLTISSYANFQGGVSLTCSGLPANAYCIFRPGLISLAQLGTSIPPQTTQMQIRAYQDPTNIQSAAGFGVLGLLAGTLIFAAMRKKRGAVQLTLCMVIGVAGSLYLSVLSGCGSSSSAADKYPTPAGTYTVTLHSTATPITSGQSPTVYSISSIEVDTSTQAGAGNIGKIFTTSGTGYAAGTVINITGNSNSALNQTVTVTTSSYLANGGGEVDFDPGNLPVGTTGTGGTLRVPNVSIPDQTFTLVVK